MGYFGDRYHDLRLPGKDEAGFRGCQLGAIHAVASHFTLYGDRAIVTMPTGSGKTAVLTAVAFLLRAERVLVVTPGRLVRGQIVDRFATLRTLREVGALADDVAGPAVYEVRGRLGGPEDWERLRAFDVVVATPDSASPALDGVAAPPSDLFDLVLVDEAHHSPAITWNALLESFPDARRVLFTATPFRRDRQEIEGRHVYTYPTSRAYADGIFGAVDFEPVAPGPSNDVAIARAAASVLERDRKAGKVHYLVVRVDSRRRAAELAEVYRAETSLDLRVVHSGHSPSRVDKAVGDLRAGRLDGVIAVNMVAEGFDLPNLKVAAVHAPYKSLAVTLQFIGRFARTNAPNIGDATFVAVPEGRFGEEIRALYEEGAVWKEIVPLIADDRVGKEVSVKEVLDEFDMLEAPEDAEARDLSLYGLRPYFHVKVYRVYGEVDLSVSVSMPRPLSVEWRYVHDDPAAAVYISRRPHRPKWAKGPEFDSNHYELAVASYDAPTGFLFLCSSRRSAPLYHALVEGLVDGAVREVPFRALERVLLDLDETNFFNLGFRSHVAASDAESYRVLNGRRPVEAVRASDGLAFDLGHLFGTAREDGRPTTIGLSGSSKVWSNRYAQIPDLLAWCGALAGKLSEDDRRPTTGTVLDFFARADDADGTEPLDRVIAATWSNDAYQAAPLASVHGGDHVNLIDAEVNVGESDVDTLDLTVSHPSFEVGLRFDRRDGRVARVAGPTVSVTDTGTGEVSELVDFVNGSPFDLLMADFARLTGRQVVRNEVPPAPFDPDSFEAVDWAGADVDITTEFNDSAGKTEDFGVGGGPWSVQRYNADRLLSEGHDVVFYDHGSGEAADFVAVREGPAGVVVELHHCKASGSRTPGAREKDAFDICAQVVKSARFTIGKDGLRRHVRRRSQRERARFLAGSLDTFEALMDRAYKVGLRFRVVLVQPGLSKARVLDDDDLPLVLSAAADFVRLRCEPLAVWGSP